MARTSSDKSPISAPQTLRPRMADGTLLVARRHDPAGKPRAIALIFPDLGETLERTEGTAIAIAKRGIRAFSVLPRGHHPSEGTWSLARHLRDYRAWIATLRRQGDRLPLLVVARGLSASLALLHEEIAHRHYSTHRPTVPDAMLLLDPIARGEERVPRGLRAHFRSRIDACNEISRKERDVLRRFTLPPVRVQTPTVIYTSGPLYSSDKHDPLRRVFGNARIRRATWLHPSTRVSRLHADMQLADACDELLAQDKPFRFRTKH